VLKRLNLQELFSGELALGVAGLGERHGPMAATDLEAGATKKLVGNSLKPAWVVVPAVSNRSTTAAGTAFGVPLGMLERFGLLGLCEANRHPPKPNYSLPLRNFYTQSVLSTSRQQYTAQDDFREASR
jgi:hypothetical protein